MTASEYFADVQRAAREVISCKMTIDELINGIAPRSYSHGAHSSGTVSDPTATAVFTSIELMQAARRRRDQCNELIGEALQIINGLHSVFYSKADVIKLHYIDLWTWADIADAMCVHSSTVKGWRNQMFVWLDNNPTAYVMACRFTEC